MSALKFEDLSQELQKVLDPAKGKALLGIAKGLAPLPANILLPAWCYLSLQPASEITEAAQKSLDTYPEKMLLPAVQSELPAWALEFIGRRLQKNEIILEAVLLNEAAPNSLFIEIAKTCSEKIANLIVNNQERIIDSPDIINSLEANPANLKSNTDRLRHFLNLSGIYIPGDAHVAEETVEETKKEEAPEKEEVVAPEDAEKLLEKAGNLTEAQRLSLTQYIYKLNIGGRVKLGLKGNKEARGILIRDTNKVVALAVLKSPKITDNEIVMYASLRNVADDVIRVISTNPAWVKRYAVKAALCFHPKCPLAQAISFLKYLNNRDLTRLSKEKNVLQPVQKAAKELISQKRK